MQRSDSNDEKRKREERGQAPAATRRAFAAWVDSVGGSREAARLLDVSRSYVDMIRSGDRSPGLVTAYRIEVRTDGAITMRAWVEGRRRNR